MISIKFKFEKENYFINDFSSKYFWKLINNLVGPRQIINVQNKTLFSNFLFHRWF